MPEEDGTVEWCRAVALDLDGTLTSRGTPDALVLDRLSRLRDLGVRLVLVTGRIMSEVEAELPGLVNRFDLVVAENGCILRSDRWTRRLADPVSTDLSAWLAVHHVPARHGEVIIATKADVAHGVLDGVAALHLEIQLVRNRSELMLLPAGVSKGTGLLAALRELRLSRHNVMAVGDAENDLSMLAVAEVSVAVANAVETVRRSADIVLDSSDGKGLLELLTDENLRTAAALGGGRRRLVLDDGTNADPATLPAQANVLITGDSESGKSYLAGLIIEQLSTLEYTMLIIDPEGDHLSLGALPGVLVLADDPLPSPSVVFDLYRHGLGVVVLDLSRLTVRAREDYLEDLWPLLVRSRTVTSHPHWVVIDEAQNLGVCHQISPTWWSATGWCLITYRPESLPAVVLGVMDWQLVTSVGNLAELRSPSGERHIFRPARRGTSHVRHLHKYTDSPLPMSRRFVFTDDGRAIAGPAGTLREFVGLLARIPPRVVAGHAQRGDFSRWLAEQYRDRVSASLVAAAERDLCGHGDADRTRTQIRQVIERRYLTEMSATMPADHH